ncbi:related to aldehyde reductase II [Fusarium fujikuroi]|nr:related to aldehyde reductase II [Fusarium fujikuroi]
MPREQHDMTGSNKIVLVTGANGFIATHVVKDLLQKGYHVRGVVRSQASADAVLKTFRDSSEFLSVIVVPSMTVAGAFDQAVKGVDAVLHIASPFTLDVNDNETELLVPAIAMTKGLLESASMYGAEIKRIVITSSFAAMVDLKKGLWPGHTYNEADWNQVTYDYAKTADAGTAYVASKALAEKAAWSFVQDRKPHFDITVLCPPMVFGPPAHFLSFSALNIAAWDINRFISGELQDVPNTDFWGFVDVRDLATAHVRALEVPEAGDERFLIAGGRYSYQQTADVLRASSRIPDNEKAKIPRGRPGDNYPGPNVYELDNSKSIRILGVEYRSFEEPIVDSAVKVVEARRKAGI